MPATATNLHIRPATAADLPAINAIYNHYVLHSTATYQTEPETEADRAAWFARHGGRFPVVVAEREGEVVGWASLSRFRERAAYDLSVENSVYVRHDCFRQGIGRTLLLETIALARALGYHTIVASIDAAQAPSIALHAAAGFFEVARFREVGRKYDRWLDVVFMQYML